MYSTGSYKPVEYFLKKVLFFIASFEKSVITRSRRVKQIPTKIQVEERREYLMENSKELIGILQAISIVAKNLAEKLMRIDRYIREYESSQAGMPGKRKKWKGK